MKKSAKLNWKGYREFRAESKQPWSEVLFAAPDLGYLVFGLMKDPRVPKAQKLKLGAMVAYLLSPLELIPIALLGPIGIGGDLAVAAHALNSLLNEMDPEILRDHWTGDSDVLEALQKIAGVSNRFLAGGIWQKIFRSARRARRAA